MRANVERVGAAVFGQSGAGHAVAAAAFERIEIVEIADGAAEACRQRRHVGADPVGDRRRHRAAQDRRRLHRDPPLVRQHHGLQPHQILAAAAAGALDVGDAGGDRDRIGQRQPAGRGRRRRGAACSAGFSASAGAGFSAAGFRARGLAGLRRGRLGRTRLRQRHRARHRAARRGFGLRSPEQVAPGPLRPGAGPARRRGGIGLQRRASASAAAVTIAAARAAKAPTRPFAACFLRAKVHGNSVNDPRQAKTHSGGTSVCLD